MTMGPGRHLYFRSHIPRGLPPLTGIESQIIFRNHRSLHTYATNGNFWESCFRVPVIELASQAALGITPHPMPFNTSAVSGSRFKLAPIRSRQRGPRDRASS